MSDVANNLWLLLVEVWPVAVVFAAIALATKRGRIAQALARSKDEFLTNVLLFAFNALVAIPLCLAPIILLEAGLRSVRLVSEEAWVDVPYAITVALAILVIDFTAYWRHRFEHSRDMWRFHATHHADTAMHWLSVQRKHPVARLLAYFTDLTLAWFLGLPVFALIAASVLRSWWGYFLHADVPWTLGVAGRYMMSPAAHRLHHIRDEELMGHNYGNTVTLWDKLFGTYLDPAPFVNCETGIEEGTRGFLGELARPFERRYRKSVPLNPTETKAA
ncbi:MAG: sterol desaturase family protein [Pseudomonadota bacterium]